MNFFERRNKYLLQLKDIKKDYVTSSETVHALRGVSLSFRQREFVSILGPSGCGKTTLLNIVGGLDKYTDGDLVINGRSTKEYRDRDWDSYRNHSIGFVFQSYNLIPHQTVLGNVELALTLSGVSKAERRERAKAALEEVGLGDQLYKRPAEMSGGQMQRVAIARALVNNPDIILADEPTGALDTKTSVQVMEILKKISKERLIIMVTHNPEIAEEYSSRIIRMVDGNIVSDSDSYSAEECEKEGARIRALAEAESAGKSRERKPSMSFFTSFMLSLRNLFTKKGRTMLTAFAGSIGIIGIALILAVSQGMTAYINSVQETTLSSYPLTLESTTVDITELMQSFMGGGDKNENKHENDAVYKDQIIAELVNALSKIEANENDLGAFKLYLEEELKKEGSDLNKALSGVQYEYQLDLDVYTEVKVFDGDESKGEVDKYEVIKSDTGEIMAEMLADFMIKLATNSGKGGQSGMGNIDTSLMGSMMQVVMWEEMLPGVIDKDGNRALINETLKKQYDVVYGAWPTAKDEIVLVLNEKNELDDLTLYALGLLPKAEIDAIVDAAASGKPLPESSNNRWTYEEICKLRFKTIFPYEKYEMVGGVAVDKSKSPLDLTLLYKNKDVGMELKVVGIIRPNEEADSTMLKGSIGYTYALTEHIIEGAKNSPVVKAQLADPKYDIFSKLPFKENTGTMTPEEKKAAFITYIENLPDEEKANAYVKIKCLDAEKEALSATVDGMLKYINSFEDLAPMMPMIEEMLKAENSTIDVSQIGNYFKNMSADAIKELLRPYLENYERTKIHKRVTDYLDETMSAELKVQMLKAELAAEPGAEPISGYTLDQFALYYDNITKFAPNTYKNNLVVLGCLDLGDPFRINLFASSFENKDIIVNEIAEYNDAVPEEQKIAYTDLLGIIMSSITTIINAITYVLIAFVSISLIVSSIMIGVITLISVQERTKEIGILRAIGASKKNVSSMFNAETMIIGLAAGLLGVTVTYLLCIPINLILHAVTGIPNLSAVLPPMAAVILVAISVLLTLISGIIPSRSAAKKDPVVALRTE